MYLLFLFLAVFGSDDTGDEQREYSDEEDTDGNENTGTDSNENTDVHSNENMDTNSHGNTDANSNENTDSNSDSNEDASVNDPFGVDLPFCRCSNFSELREVKGEDEDSRPVSLWCIKSCNEYSS